MLEKKQAALVTVDPSFKLELHWLVGLVGCDGEARLQEIAGVGEVDMIGVRGEEGWGGKVPGRDTRAICHESPGTSEIYVFT